MVGNPWKEGTLLVQTTGQLPPYETYRLCTLDFSRVRFVIRLSNAIDNFALLWWGTFCCKDILCRTFVTKHFTQDCLNTAQTMLSITEHLLFVYFYDCSSFHSRGACVCVCVCFKQNV